MHTTKTTLNIFGSLNKIERRDLIEKYCYYATMLPVDDKLLFYMYYKHGYSCLEIGQLLMKHHVTIARRLKRICISLNKLVDKLAEDKKHE